MRELLFRGKRTDNGEWVWGYLVIHDYKYYIYYEKADEFCQTGNWLCSKEVIPETVGQYTGLTDKNGTKIFEGDIVKLFLRDCVDIGIIQYNDKMYRFVFCSISIDGKYGGEYGFDMTCVFEVIGNIHDNPELLERGCDNG